MNPARIFIAEGWPNGGLSLDGQWLALFGARELKKMRIGEAPVSIANIGDPRGMTWVDNQTLVYAPQAADGLQRIAADGATPTTITTIDAKRGERSHRWPTALPGGKGRPLHRRRHYEPGRLQPAT